MNKTITRIFTAVLPAALLLGGLAISATAQLPPGEPIKYPKKLEIALTNPLDIARTDEPVVIPLAEITKRAPDFNRNFFRVKRSADEGFEPLDLPSQIRLVPAAGYSEELVFQVDLAPRERKVVSIQYNPEGTNPPRYPVYTQAFERWYTGGVNIAWENEVNSYRSYSGVVDYFAKSFEQLRLHDLPADSYHHEETWGVDPFMIGRKPGLCGVALVNGNTLTPCYGGRDSLLFTHRAFGGGPVFSGAVVRALDKGELILEETFTLFSGRHDNHLRIAPARKLAALAVGMQRNDGETVRFDERAGYLVSWAPAGEYGTIAHILVFRPADYMGKEDVLDGHFVKLKPAADGSFSCLSIGAWYRVSDAQPKSFESLVRHAQYMAGCFANPVRVEFAR
ncbi:MAG: DUF4861 family protein, partial [Candidatus Latescibacterota bacterium]